MRSKFSFMTILGLWIALVVPGPMYGAETVLQCDAGNGHVQAGWAKIGPALNSNVAGTGIDVELAAGSGGPIQFYQELGNGPLAEVEGDFCFTSGPDADIVLTLSNLPGGDYVLKSFHNRLSETVTSIANVTVSGAADVTVPDSIVQNHAIMENPAEILLRTTGEDVVITYRAAGGAGMASQVFFNGFILESGSQASGASAATSPAAPTVTVGDLQAYIRPGVSFASAASSVSERVRIIHRPAKALVTLSVPSDSMVTVDYRVIGGTAQRGLDFILDDGTLAFAPGQVKTDITVEIVNDNVIEPDETIVLRLLYQSPGVLLGRITEHTMTIIDGGQLEEPNYDLSRDGAIDFDDVVVLLTQWLECTLDPPSLCFQ